MADDSPLKDAQTYCADLVRRFDRDRYICALLSPDHVRPHLMALYAFNIEIAITSETVSNPLIGQMRLKWWHDALDDISRGHPPAHQVALPLSVTVRQTRLPQELLAGMISARLEDFAESPPETLTELTSYADRTAGTLAELSMMAMGHSENSGGVTMHQMGTAYALTGLIRALPFARPGQRIFLPTDLCQQENFNITDLNGLLSRQSASPELCHVLCRVADHAETLVAAVCQAQTSIPSQVMAVLLPAALTRRQLSRLKLCGHDPFRLKMAETGPNPGDMLRLAWARFRRRI